MSRFIKLRYTHIARLESCPVTLSWLSEISGVPEGTLKRWQSGRAETISADLWNRLRPFLGKTYEELCNMPRAPYNSNVRISDDMRKKLNEAPVMELSRRSGVSRPAIEHARSRRSEFMRSFTWQRLSSCIDEVISDVKEPSKELARINELLYVDLDNRIHNKLLSFKHSVQVLATLSGVGIFTLYKWRSRQVDKIRAVSWARVCRVLDMNEAEIDAALEAAYSVDPAKPVDVVQPVQPAPPVVEPAKEHAINTPVVQIQPSVSEDFVYKVDVVQKTSEKPELLVAIVTDRSSGTVRWIRVGGTDFSDHRWQYFTSVVDLSTWSGSAKAAWLAWREECVKALRAAETEMIAVAEKMQNCLNEIDRIGEDGTEKEQQR